MVGEKFFKDAGSMWVGGPALFLPASQRGESDMKIILPQDGDSFGLR